MAGCRIVLDVVASQVDGSCHMAGWDYMFPPYIYDGLDITLKIARGRVELLLAKKRLDAGRRQSYLRKVAGAELRAVRDALLKACVIHTLSYGWPIDETWETEAHLCEDGSAEELCPPETSRVPLNVTISGKHLDRLERFSQCYGCERFYGYLNSTKSGGVSISAGDCKVGYERLYSSVWALILAKSKDNESERFINLWIALNGVYGYLFQAVQGLTSVALKSTENCKLNVMAWYLHADVDDGSDWQSFGEPLLGTSKERGKELRDVIRALNKEGMNLGALLRSRHDEREGFLSADVDTYIMLSLGYTVRCDLLHAGKPIPVANYDLGVIRCLRQINDRIEQYLDDNLFSWFEAAYVKAAAEKVLPRAVRCFAAKSNR